MRTVSHDLRSPLTSIMLSVDRLRDSEGQPMGPMLKVLDREARRLEAIIRSLLDQAKSESFTDSLSPRLCRPGEVLEGLTDTLRLKAEARDLDTHLELDPAVDSAWILADTTALQQVLFNLIENALKFTDPPGTIGIRSILEEDAWTLEVWDTGRGIEPSRLGDIFQAFRQVQEADAQKGWGLGLNICKTLIEAHAGRIEVVSEVGRGSTFRVSLPLVMPNREIPGSGA
jgi:signal transduction histidine kinase